jgi:hypothetical protein
MGASNLAVHLPQHCMLKVNDLIVQGCLLPQVLPMLGSLLRLQRSIGNAPMRRLLSRGNTSLYTTFEHFLSPCTPRADTQAHVLIGWHLGAHTHSHVDTRPALGAAALLTDLFVQ